MTKQGPSYEVTNLEEQHIEQILQLQQKVIHALPDKKVLQPLAKEEFLNILRGNGKMVGAWVKEQLIAFRALLIPPENDPEHLGLDAGVTDLSTVIYQEISNVDPMYRGNKLQQKLAQILMEQLKKNHISIDMFVVQSLLLITLHLRISLPKICKSLILRRNMGVAFAMFL